VLGFDPFESDPDSQPRLPRNPAVAFFSGHRMPIITDVAGDEVELDRLGPEPTPGHAGLLTPLEPLEPGMGYTLDHDLPLVIDDYVDETAPSPPAVRGGAVNVSEEEGFCAQSSCGTLVVLHVDLDPGEDEHTPRQNLTYAVFVQGSAERARNAEQPARLALLAGSQVSFFLDEAWADRDVWVSVAALDLAGNPSERTEPMMVHSGSGSCRIAPGVRPFGVLAWIALALVAVRLRRSGGYPRGFDLNHTSVFNRMSGSRDSWSVRDAVLFRAHTIPILGLLAALAWMVPRAAAAQEAREFGLGIIIGDPTGLSGKYFFSEENALDFAVGLGVLGGGHLHVHADYLWHFPLDRWSSGRFDLYAGVGPKLGVGKKGKWGKGDDGDVRLGIRGPLGVSVMFLEAPFDVFVEVAAGLWIVEKVRFDLDAAIGARYWF
jgi:hypothetical protein